MLEIVKTSERHVDLHKKDNRRKSEVLQLISPLRKLVIRKDRLMKILYGLGINDSEIEWLKRHGHLTPVKDSK